MLAQATIAQADTTWIIIAVVVMDVVAIATIATREHLQRLRFPFGPQYDRAVERMAILIGSGLAGVISMAVGAGLRVPHGGIFVLPIPGAFLHLFDYIALLAGTVVSALCLGVLKRPIADASAVK